ncbi:surface lipoprotein assembly modifier [Caulobacter sp. DWR1-3-2b1]|uniref:surface lipoprotein assembly modifier n=1 Tax=Caulobacter sp. DWR1-3-2b1 TaxID=2804670 RepID=UPI003CFA4C93
MTPRPGRVALPLITTLVLAALATSPAQARQAEPPLAIGEANRDFADALMRDLRVQDHAAALTLIETRADIAATAAGVRLRAELLAKLGRSSEAIALLEAHLTQDDNDALARYQLGEIHFAARRDRSATLAYRLALAGQLDPQRRAIAAARLTAIEARRGLTLSFSASIAPDSNINGATDATSVSLFGLPFTLSDDARRQSGVAASLGMSAERRWRLSESLAVKVGGTILAVDTPGRSVDQSQWALYAGPTLRLNDRAQLDLAATYRDIRFGGAALESWQGAQASAEIYVRQDLRWDGLVHLDRIDSRRGAAFDGWSYGLRAGRTRFLGPSALWRASAVVDVRDLVEPQASYGEARLATGRLFALPFTILAYVEPYAQARRFAQRSSLFGVRRLDREVGVTARLSRRDLYVLGAFPFIQVTASRAVSNVPLGRYARQRMEFGFTRDF